jgi:hypothetical protein
MDAAVLAKIDRGRDDNPGGESAMNNKTKIGHLLLSLQSVYCLETALRLHRLLVERSLSKSWRFKNRWVTTGPFETLMGHRSCGTSFDDVTCFHLFLSSSHGEENAVKKLFARILDAMFEYPGLACLNEDVAIAPWAWSHEFDFLREYENCQTHRPLNEMCEAARTVRNVGLKCRDSGIYLTVKVVLPKSCSSWDLFWLAQEDEPRWNMQVHLDTWLTRTAIPRLDRLVKRCRIKGAK